MLYLGSVTASIKAAVRKVDFSDYKSRQAVVD
jgi:hypothetical protein